MQVSQDLRDTQRLRLALGSNPSSSQEHTFLSLDLYQ